MYSKDKSAFLGVRKALPATLAILASACDRPASVAHADAASDAEPTRALMRGDRVVVEAEAAEFFEARVLEVSSDRAKVQLASGESRSVAAGDMYRIGAAGSVKPGQLGICNLGAAEWVGCRVRASGADLEVVVPGKGTRHVASGAVLTPTSVTELNIQRHFERAKDREDFEHELSRAGAPRAPEGWKASPAEHVLVRIDGAWYSGSVAELGKKAIKIELSGSSRVTELPRSEVIPAPPYTPPPRKGELALARPLSLSSPWTPVRVESATDAEIVVKDVAGARRSSSASELVPLGR